jgi:DNA polymerase/3'-5' exonuclease PolX
VGSVRRQSPYSKDIDMLAVVADTTPLSGVLASAVLKSPTPRDYLTIMNSYASGSRRRSLIVKRAPGKVASYYAVDLFLATETEKPFALFHFTNGRQYNIRVRAYAKKKGLTLNQYGLYTCVARNGKKTKRRASGTSAIRTEKDLARYLGITYRAPPDRPNA